MRAPAPPVLTVEELSIGHAGEAPQIDRISLTISPGERVGVVGETGAGKSLIAAALLGLLRRGRQATGSVLVGDTEVVGADEETLTGVRGSRVGLVFPAPTGALDPLQRVGRQVAEPLRRHQGLTGVALRTAVRLALADVALTDLDRVMRAYPHELSGAQRQRVALAMAFAGRPHLLVADEPTTGLDAAAQAELMALLRALCREHGTALLLLSHDLALTAAAVDSLLVLRGGSIVERGPVATVLHSPSHRYTQSLVNAAGKLEAALTTGTIQ